MSATELLKQLVEEGKSLIIVNDGRKIFSSSEVGLTGLLKAIEEVDSRSLDGSVVADRVVGKAAALVAISFGARELHAIVMSRSAIDVLRKHSRIFSHINLVDEIKDKSGLDTCRYEKMVANVEDPKEALKLIREALRK
ncbi:MAG: DUF1893 domain-containing protein [Thermoproteota archaeon]